TELVNPSLTSRGIPGKPQPFWDFQSIARIQQPAAVTENVVMFASTGREVFGIKRDKRELVYKYEPDSPVSSDVEQLGNTAYAATQDGVVYALDIPTGQVPWRFVANGRVLQQPVATETDLFVVVIPGGLTRVNRTTGELIWQQPDAGRFLAANPKFVYATALLGKLLVVDRSRGIGLSNVDCSDSNLPVTNHKTDRLFLAANDGTLLCLHDRQYPKPLANQVPRAAAPPPPKDVPKKA